ncbi:MAG: SPOR domain-containing protein [Sphingomonadales bacterium]|jgi:hypothetical protein
MGEERLQDNIKDEDSHDLPWLQPVEDEGEEGWLSARTLIMATVVFVVIFAALLWVIYAQLSGHEEPRQVATRSNLPVIEAPDEPHKILPDDPGGAEIPGQDKLVLEAANGDDVEGDTRLATPAETPVEREAGGSFVEPEPETVEQAFEATPPPVQVEPEPAPVKPKPQAQTQAQTQTATNGRYLIQLGAFSTDVRARTGWQQIQDKYPNIVGDLTLDTQIATVNGRTIYRLRGAALPTRAEADRRCAALKAAGQGCLVTER